MHLRYKKPELLAPAGNPEKLKTAIHYGADAVYFGGKDFSLRNFAGNFSFDEMKEAIVYSKDKGVKTYVTCNIYPKNKEMDNISKYLEELAKLNPDALIIADPGILRLAKKYAPNLAIHLSTQANTTNIESVKFWSDFGVSRVNLARELSLEEIIDIKKETKTEIETFIHGAMCISYSGRCMLSSFMSKRSGNLGECTHPCRWKYQLEEELRPGEYYPVSEDERGTYIFNSKDLCMLPYIDRFIKAGVDSVKIEGRMKGIFYLACVVKVYREAIDSFFEKPNFTIEPYWNEILQSVANRQYSTGFYLNDPDSITPNFENLKPVSVHNFLGKIVKKDVLGFKIGVRNKIVTGEEIKILSPKTKPTNMKVEKILDVNGNNLNAGQPNQEVIIQIKADNLYKGDLVYKA